MPTYELIVKNVRVVTDKAIKESEIYVDNGKIISIGFHEAVHSADVIIDGRGMLALPGLVDTHVHFRDPGMLQKEDFETGTRGAAAGGTTTILDMPTTQPVVTNPTIFKDKLKVVEKKALVDFGLYAAAGMENMEQLHDLAKIGAIAFKSYTVSPPSERVKEYAGAVVRNTGELFHLLENSTATGLLHCIHAEDDSVVQYLTSKLQASGRKDAEAHCESRPNLAEALAVHQAIGIAEMTGGKIHLLHISTREAVQMIRSAKARGIRVTAETCPHYLFFTKGDMQKLGPYGKYNPPARSHGDIIALWEGLKDGTIDAVVSDHAPHSREEKDDGREDIWKAPPGTPGVETRLPLVLSRAMDWGLDMLDVVRLCAKNPAKIFGLEWRKGEIAEGMDADITLMDPGAVWKIKSSELQTKARETVIFDGMEVKGKIAYTIVRGRVVFEREVGFEKPGVGSFLAGQKAISDFKV
ncbi:MAG: allantoinase AllB [Conexivisphaerales archaeon]